ncbi:hypothetical protein [Salinibacter grassmerensis]|uniref:hypothetical protein n=1 Tax=Salinibacter grassmerensis TaxID=3040353 RepID=UPI0021E7576E|nr:hypothetical protein [Salinibacter grassmerensis]
MGKKKEHYFDDKRVLNLHLEDGMPPSRIADMLDTTYERVVSILGDERLERSEQIRRENEYYRRQARKIMEQIDQEAKEERIERYLNEE